MDGEVRGSNTGRRVYAGASLYPCSLARWCESSWGSGSSGSLCGNRGHDTCMGIGWGTREKEGMGRNRGREKQRKVPFGRVENDGCYVGFGALCGSVGALFGSCYRVTGWAWVGDLKKLGIHGKLLVRLKVAKDIFVRMVWD